MNIEFCKHLAHRLLHVLEKDMPQCYLNVLMFLLGFYRLCSSSVVVLVFLFQVDQFEVYREYILNYKTALLTIRKCKASNEQFNNIFSKVRCEVSY